MSDIRFNRWLHQSGTGGVSQDSSGHIGIGTTVPTMALDVRGDVNIGNTININNASGIISATTFTGTTGTFSGNVSAVDATFTGNVTIGGTLTYEDVANIDAVGIITAQSDIIVGGGLTVTGISTFNNDVKLLDNDTLKFGIGEDLRIYHDASHSYITNATADLRIRSSYLKLQGSNGENMLVGNQNTNVEIYYDNSKKFETTNTGAVVTGILTATSSITGPNYEIAAISSSISDTAVDVFVYDTRKDSDGGAWRKRTQHTSWYNETLGTATRGTRKEFPAVAVLVLEAGKLTIYDGDDPDLPMWMVFNNTGSNVGIFGRSLSTKTSVEMLNGLLVICGSYSSAHFEAFTHINFISEKCQQTDNTGTVVFNKNISQRGETSTYTQDTSSFTLVNIVSVNDVAMTVLPNAPIDDATGLPVPTIAVGTDGGVSVIKDDGSVVDLTYQESTNRIVRMIDIDSNGRIYWSTRETGSAPGVYFHEADLPAADSSAEPPVNIAANQAGTNNGVKPTLISGSLRDVIRTKDRTILSLSGYDNKAHLNLYNVTGDVNSSGSVDNFEIVDISTDYNTGYIIGDIKGAFLSDTDDTNITGTNIIDNGDFGSNFTNWSIGGDTTPTIDSGGAKISTAATIDGYIWQSTSGEAVGGKWIISWTLTANTSGFVGLVINGTQPANGSSYSSGGTLVKDGITASGSYYYDGTITAVEFRHRGGGGGHAIIDNITFKRVEEDRSVNNKGLEVFGTITKSAVATGAELVAYSGWSSSNYLIQPYNSGLDFGTGNWSYMFWYNPNDAESGDILFTRWSYNINNSTAGRIGVYFNSGNLRVDLTDDGASSYQGHFGSDGTQDSNEWHCAVILRRGPNLEIWIDGVNYRNAALNSSADGSYTNTSAILEIGNSPGMGAAEAGLELALLRASASAPSAEQIKKIYEDEKVLFQENAKATLYGSSDAVTALAYDEDTELLHVGTSAGRSDFQGLRRINNTTTAVTTAISASDDLIAEQ